MLPVPRLTRPKPLSPSLHHQQQQPLLQTQPQPQPPQLQPQQKQQRLQ